MFTNSTVFILGAGASWHYGYPTGEGLVDCVISMAGRFASHCDRRIQSGQVTQLVPLYVAERMDSANGIQGAVQGWKRVRDECLFLVHRLKAVRPLVIDYFLAWNESLRPIGRLMIAAVILECEAQWLKLRANDNRRLARTNSPDRPSSEELQRLDITKYQDDWYRFVVHKLVYGCTKSEDLFKNKVRFVTFNYDTSLEYHLYNGLVSLDILDPDHVKRFLGEDRIAHVYGAVHSELPPVSGTADPDVASGLGGAFGTPLVHEVDFQPRQLFLDQCLGSSHGLRTIDFHDKDADEKTLSQARDWIAEADIFYILGYGFDQNNNRRIGLDPTLRKSTRGDQSVMFTNFRDLNTINKKAARLFFGTHESFLDRSIHGNPLKGGYLEKSIRDVYQALEMDFDALEEQLIATSKI